MTQQPTIGRIVHWQQADSDVPFNGSKVHPAIITRVWSDTCVNLTIFPDAGVPMTKTSVSALPAEGDENRKNGGWFWPHIAAATPTHRPA